VASPSIESHFAEIESVLHAFQEHNITFKLSKCHFFQEKLEYLGFEISEHGVTAREQNVEAIKSFPAPKCVKDVRAFLGSINYFRKSIISFANIATPLNQLLRKNVRFVWGPRQQDAFDKLKNALLNAPVRGFFDPSLPVTLFCDSSDYAVGFALCQCQDGVDRLIAAGGKTIPCFWK
jgi:hypothetical protein